MQQACFCDNLVRSQLRFCKLVSTKLIINEKVELNFALMHLLKIT